MSIVGGLTSSFRRMSPRIGVLWDSLSRNLGDQAIGPCVIRLARRAGFPQLAAVPIGDSIVQSFDLLVIGGGELLHPPGHSYYDLFRVPGPHILNTVGTNGELDAAYLESYRLVSVRSERDRRNLANLDREVRVAPCLTVLFDQVVEPGAPIELPVDAIGVHLHPASFQIGESAQVLDVLRQLGPRTVLFPFTHYNQDREVQLVVAEQLGLPGPLAVDTPDQAYDVIRRLGSIVTTSLHATIMAYIAGVPFIAIGYASKVANFLTERGLSHRLVGSFIDVGPKLDLLSAASIDWEDRLAADRRDAEGLLAAILAELEEAFSQRPRRPRSYTRWSEPAHARESHTLMMQSHEQYGLRIAEVLAHAYDRERFTARRERFEQEEESLKAELARVREYTEQLETQLRQVKQELEKAGPYARSLERRLEELPAEAPRPTNGGGEEGP